MDTNSHSIAANPMIDLGWQGCYCTWTNKMIKERLDRSLCNGDRRVRHLPRMKLV